MMDIEKLIERLKQNTSCWTDTVYGYADLRLEAATALSTLQAENEKLRADVVRFNDLLASYQNVLVPELRVENENLKERIEDTRLEWYAKGFGEVIAEVKRVRAELEQVTLENNALWAYIEIVDREYRRYMDRGYIDRLYELKKVWKHGQKED